MSTTTASEPETAQETVARIRRATGADSSEPLDLRNASLAGVDLTDADLGGADLTGADLSGADLTRANLTRARLFKANLHKTVLREATLDDAELTGADLTFAHLDEASARRAGFGMASLRGASLFQAALQGSTLTKADLGQADMRCAQLRDTRIREAILEGANFTGADLRGADLALSRVAGATFNDANLQDARLRAVTGFESAHWIGTDIRNINFAGAYSLRRHAIDENYLKEFREKGRLAEVVYRIWLVTSDCGRSMTRWCFWIAALALVFAGLYTLCAVDYGDHPTSLSPLYYSIVTLTTLGYGDVVPASRAAQIVAVSEVIIGYIMLGGLLSIMSNKMARRGE